MDSPKNLKYDLSPRSHELKKRKCSDDIHQLYDLDNLKLESQCKIVIMSDTPLYNIILRYLGNCKQFSKMILSKYENKESYQTLPCLGNYKISLLDHSYEIIIFSDDSNGIALGSDSQNNIYELIDDAKKTIQEVIDKPYIQYFILHDNQWNHLYNRKKRSFDTLFLPTNIENSILKDIQQFLTDEKVYDHFGLSYKRNYLFSGHPGTGKSTYIHCIASFLNYNIYTIPIHDHDDMCDTSFITSISKIPNNSILLIEDVDQLIKNQKKLSISALLTVLDGIGINKGLLIFLTTNYLNEIPNEIIRPGRIDMKVEFTYAKKEQITRMYDKYFPKPTKVENTESVYKEVDDINEIHIDKTGEIKKIDKKKSDFLKAIQNKKITISALQQYFFNYRDVDEIIKNVIDLDKMMNHAEYSLFS